MQATLKTNVGDLIGKWKNRPDAVRRALEAEAHALAPIMLQTAQQVMQKRIYSVAIPRSRTGRPLWARTGELLRSEYWKAVGVDVYGENSSAHAEARRTLGLPGGRRIVSPGVQAIDWQVQAVLQRRTLIFARRHAAVLRGLVKR